MSRVHSPVFSANMFSLAIIAELFQGFLPSWTPCRAIQWTLFGGRTRSYEGGASLQHRLVFGALAVGCPTPKKGPAGRPKRGAFGGQSPKPLRTPSLIGMVCDTFPNWNITKNDPRLLPGRSLIDSKKSSHIAPKMIIDPPLSAPTLPSKCLSVDKI